MIDTVLGNKPPPQPLAPLDGLSKYALLAIAVGAGLALTALENGVAIIAEYVNTKLNQTMVLDLRSDMFKHVHRLTQSFMDVKRTGQLMFEINNQASAAGAITVSIPPLVEAGADADRDVRDLDADRLGDERAGRNDRPALYSVSCPSTSTGAASSRAFSGGQQKLEWQFAVDRQRGDVYDAGDRLLRARGLRAQALPRAGGETAVDERVKLTVSQRPLYTMGVQTALRGGHLLGDGVSEPGT